MIQNKKKIHVIQNRIYLQSSGGYEIQIFNICIGLTRFGWQICHLAEANKPETLTQDGIHIRFIKPRYYFSFINFPAFKKVKADPPQIVYQRSRNNFSCGLIGLRYAKKAKAKFVFGFGCIDDLHPCFLTKTLWKDKRKNIIKKILASADTLIKDYLFRYNIRKADLLISQNAEQQEACRKQYGRESVIIRSIHPAVNKEISKSNPPVICWIANARPVKQPELFVELIESLNDLWEKQSVRFIMVFGKNLPKYIETDLLNKLKQYPYVEIIGELTIEEANDVMEKSSLLVNTSLYEGFSNTFIQAWLRETPVISLNSDPDDIIMKHRIGFHSGSMEQMKKDVRFLFEHPDEMTKMGKSARSYAEEHHNIEKIASQLDELFTNLIRK